jgi:hypothetical protein
MANGELLSVSATAAYLGVSTYTLQMWRSTGKGPAFFKLEKKISYRMDDIMHWVNERRIDQLSTAS